jgi:hypothetical protein
MIVARQFIAWNRSQKRPSRRARYDRWDGGLIWSAGLNDIVAADHTVPYGTDLCLGRVPGNELPGYDHPVPTGQISFFPFEASHERRSRQQGRCTILSILFPR